MAIPQQQLQTTTMGPSTAPLGAIKGLDSSQQWYLIKFTEDPTPGDASTGQSLPWLYDSQAKTFRPFESYFALDRFAAANGSDGSALIQQAETLNPADLSNFPGTFLSISYSPSAEDGSMPPYNPGGESTPGPSITSRYGRERHQDAETLSGQGLGVLFTGLNADGHISDETLKTLSDPTGTTLAKYISASLYGGYSMPEIYQDLKIKELAKTDPRYSNMRTVDESAAAAQFRKDPIYATSSKDPNLMPPAITLQDGSDLMKYPVYKISDKFYQENVKTIDWKDPKFQAEAEKIVAGFYDAAIALSEADSDQAKKIANDNYQRYVEAVNKKYGLQLSNNAREAWSQVQSLFGDFSAKNLADSGLYQEAQDRYLTDVRRSDQLMRESKATEGDVQQRNFLLQSGSAEQIADSITKMDTEDRAAGKPPDQFRSNLWGLKPSADTLAFYDMANLKTKYPDLTDEEVKMVRDSVVDPYGNFRSEIYRKSISNKLNLGQDKKTYQQGELERQKLEAYNRSVKQFTPSMGSYVPPDDVSRTEKVPAKEPLIKPVVRGTAPEGWTTNEQGNFVPPTPKPPAQPAETPKPPAPTSSGFKIPTGFEQIEGAKYNTAALQQGAYSDIKVAGTLGKPGSFLYGKRKVNV